MSKRTFPAAIATIILLAASLLLARERHHRQESAGPAAVDDGLAVYFSPHGGCTEAIVEQLNSARRSIDMLAYSFTSTDIAKALADAEERGVKIRAVIDKKATGEHYSGATYLQDHQIPVWLDGEHPIAHNKVMVIDGATVITGSFNFTKQAENSNAENLLVITGHPKLAEAYERNFEHHLAHSQRYEGVVSSDGTVRRPARR